MLLFIGVWKVYQLYKEKELNAKFFILIASAVILGITSTLQPLLPVKEYAKYSIRGTASAMNLESKEVDSKAPKEGLDYNYATSWSFPPSEYMTFVIPRFYGGGTAVYYTGKDPKFRQVRNKQVLGYWGQMSVTSSSEYVGIVVVFFALAGLYGYRKLSFMKLLVGLLGFSVLLSFGKHFSFLYDLFYYYVPFFNKFRTPMMILFIVNIVVVIFAAYGMKFLTSSENKGEKLKAFYIAGGVTVGICLLSLLMSDSMDFFRESDKRYGDSLQFYIGVRKAMFEADVQRTLLFALGITALTYFYLKGKLNSAYVYIAIALSTVDLYNVNQRYLTEKIGNRYTHLSDTQQLTKQFFQKKKYDDFILSDNKKIGHLAEKRVYPIQGNFWNTNEYSYYHQSIGGYDPAKLRVVQDLVEFMADNRGIFYRNVTNMLNVGYYLIDQQLPNQYPFDELDLVFKDGKRHVYKNNQSAGRAWFVDSIHVSKSFIETRANLADRNFDVRKTAILENLPNQEIMKSKDDTVIVNNLSLHTLSYETKNANQSLLVFSEIYYPTGWKAYIDGVETPIYKTNHALRSIVVPAGEHQIEMNFNPPVLQMSIMVSNISTIIAFLLLFLGVYFEFIKKEDLEKVNAD